MKSTLTNEVHKAKGKFHLRKKYILFTIVPNIYFKQINVLEKINIFAVHLTHHCNVLEIYIPNEDNTVMFIINEFYQTQNINKVTWQKYDRKMASITIYLKRWKKKSNSAYIT